MGVVQGYTQNGVSHAGDLIGGGYTFNLPAVPVGRIQMIFVSVATGNPLNRLRKPAGWHGLPHRSQDDLQPLVMAGSYGTLYGWWRVGTGAPATVFVEGVPDGPGGWFDANCCQLEIGDVDIPLVDPLVAALNTGTVSPLGAWTASDLTVPPDSTIIYYWHARAHSVPTLVPPSPSAERFRDTEDVGSSNTQVHFVTDLRGSDAAPEQTLGVSSTTNATWAEAVTIAFVTTPHNARTDRVRSAYSETIGSLMEVTRVAQAEIQLDEAFFPDVDLDPTVETDFVEALAPDVVIATRYPVPTSNVEHLATYRARTNLGRIADTYPPAVVARTVDIGLGDDATLTQLLNYLVGQWQAQYTWLRFEPIPDLRFPVPDDPYTNPSTGTLRLPALTIAQESDRRLSIRQIIDDFLSLIPGVVRQTSSGSIEIVPFWGPDAPSTPTLVLDLEDLASIDNAKADPSQMFNGATVQARGGAFQQDQQLNEPSFAVQTFFRRAFLDEQGQIPVDRSEFPEPDAGFFASGILGTQTFAVLAGGNEISVEWGATAYSAISGGSSNPNPNIPHSLITEGSTSGTITLLRGGPAVSVVVSGTVYVTQPIRYTWTFRWVDEGLQVSVQSNAQGAYNGFLNEARLFASILEFDVVGEAFVPSSVSVTGRFSLSNGDNLPGPGGSNALETSEAMYGPRELQVSTDIFPLTPVQAQQIAQALTIEHINPKTTRRFEQSWWNAYRVKPDHAGRLVELPGGEVARVQDRGGRDDWTGVPQLESTVAVVLTTAALDTSDSLLYDGGGFVQFDGGELALRS